MILPRKKIKSLLPKFEKCQRLEDFLEAKCEQNRDKWQPKLDDLVDANEKTTAVIKSVNKFISFVEAFDTTQKVAALPGILLAYTLVNHVHASFFEQ